MYQKRIPLLLTQHSSLRKSNLFIKSFSFFTTNNEKNEKSSSLSNSHQSIILLSKNLFINGEYQIVTTKRFSKSAYSLTLYGILYPLIVYSGVKVVYKLLALKIFGTCFYVLIFLGLNMMKSNLVQRSAHFVTELNLLDDGKRLKIVTMSKSFIVDISNIRLLKDEEKLAYEAYYAERLKNFIPFIINNSMYLLHSKAEVLNKEVLKNVSMGNYIQISSNDENDETIDV